jgi:hypothetical protein
MPPTESIGLEVDIERQILALLRNGRVEREWAVSTAINGPGEQVDSGCTPRGEHRVRIKIGGDCELGSVFVGRRPTGEVYSPALARRYPDRDWILTRILWLSGCQPGFNRGRGCDSLSRYIYIHGCPDSEPMGVPRSHGCVRMRNADVVALYDLVDVGTRVTIHAGSAM